MEWVALRANESLAYDIPELCLVLVQRSCEGAGRQQKNKWRGSGGVAIDPGAFVLVLFQHPHLADPSLHAFAGHTHTHTRRLRMLGLRTRCGPAAYVASVAC